MSGVLGRHWHLWEQRRQTTHASFMELGAPVGGKAEEESDGQERGKGKGTCTAKRRRPADARSTSGSAGHLRL